MYTQMCVEGDRKMNYKDWVKNTKAERHNYQYSQELVPDLVKANPTPKKMLNNQLADYLKNDTYTVPDNMSDEVAQAICLGAMVEDELLTKASTSSSTIGTENDAFKRQFVLMNVAKGDPRSASFYQLMPKARENTRQAFEKYATGDNSDVRKYALSLLQVAKELKNNRVTTTTESVCVSKAITGCLDLYNAGILTDADIDELTMTQFKSVQNMRAQMESEVQAREEFAQNLPTMNQEQRKKATLDIVTNAVIADIYTNSDTAMSEPLNQEVEKRVKALDEPLGYEWMFVADTTGLNNFRMENTMDFIHYMVSDPERKKELTACVAGLVGELPEYKTLQTATADELADHMSQFAIAGMGKNPITLDAIKKAMGENRCKQIQGEIDAINASTKEIVDKKVKDFFDSIPDKVAQYRVQKEQREAENSRIYDEEKANKKRLEKTYGKDEKGRFLTPGFEAFKDYMNTHSGGEDPETLFFMVDGNASKVQLYDAYQKLQSDGNIVWKRPDGTIDIISATFAGDDISQIGHEHRIGFRFDSNELIENMSVNTENLELLKGQIPPAQSNRLRMQDALPKYIDMLEETAKDYQMSAEYLKVIEDLKAVSGRVNELCADGSNSSKETLAETIHALNNGLEAIAEYENAGGYGNVILNSAKDMIQSDVAKCNEVDRYYNFGDNLLDFGHILENVKNNIVDPQQTMRNITFSKSELGVKKEMMTFLEELRGYDVDEQYADSYANYVEAIKNVIDTTDRMYRTEDGVYRSNANDVRQLLDRYNSAIQAYRKLNENITTFKQQNDLSRDERLAIEKHEAMLKHINDVMEKDIVSISDLKPQDNMSVPDAIYNGRTQNVQVASDVQFGKVGDRMSSRIPLEYTDESGNVHKGFFTENTAYNDRTRLDSKFDEIIERTQDPEAKNILTRLKTAIHSPDVEYNYSDMSHDITSMMSNGQAFTEEEIEQLKQHPNAELEERYNEMQEYAREYRSNNPASANRLGQMKLNDFSDDSPIAARNTAMSRIANALGVSDVIAASTEMKIVQNGQELSGHFMEAADGVDMSSVVYGDACLNYGPEVYEAPEGKVNMAKLQVLDYICGNVDRHGRNFMYRFDTSDPEHPRFIGPKGIDNDLSFIGKALDTDKAANINDVALDDITVIPRSMADAVKALQPEMVKVMLQDLGLSEQEMDACTARLTMLKSHLVENANGVPTRGKCLIVDDDRLGEFTLEQLSGGMNHKNQFDRLQGIQSEMMSEARRNYEKNEKRNNRILEREADLNASEKEFFTKTELASAHSEASISDNMKEFSSLLADLKKTKTFTHRSHHQFDDMVKALEDMVAFGKQPFDDLTYQKLLNKVVDTSEKYLEYKTKINGKTAENRVKLAVKLHSFAENAKENYLSDMEIQHERDAVVANNEMNQPVANAQPGDELTAEERMLFDFRNTKASMLNMQATEQATHQQIIDGMSDVSTRMANVIKNPNLEYDDNAVTKLFRERRYNKPDASLTAGQRAYAEAIYEIADVLGGIKDAYEAYFNESKLPKEMMQYTKGLQGYAKHALTSIPKDASPKEKEVAGILRKFTQLKYPEFKVVNDTMEKLNKILSEMNPLPASLQTTKEMVTEHMGISQQANSLQKIDQVFRMKMTAVNADGISKRVGAEMMKQRERQNNQPEHVANAQNPAQGPNMG